MGRKRIYADDKQKMKEYRKRRTAKLQELKTAVQISENTDLNALRLQIKKELEKNWEPELKAERIAAERKKGRELAKKADQNYNHGVTVGICRAASFFVGSIDRADIARALLSHFMIDRDTASAALEADKRTSSLTLTSLDKAEAWKTSPKIIK